MRSNASEPVKGQDDSGDRLYLGCRCAGRCSAGGSGRPAHGEYCPTLRDRSEDSKQGRALHSVGKCYVRFISIMSQACVDAVTGTCSNYRVFHGALALAPHHGYNRCRL